MKNNKIEKGKLVVLEYKTFAENKLIDSSEMHKPLEIVYGFTKISKALEEKLKDKSVGDSFEIKQKVNTPATTIELPLDNFDDTTVEIIQNNKFVDFEMEGQIFYFEVLKVNPDKNTAILKYSDPFQGKTLIHKLKVKEIKDLIKKESN
jgi:FKBP-type peptidyl-prolyl cis-trans isomerase 2